MSKKIIEIGQFFSMKYRVGKDKIIPIYAPIESWAQERSFVANSINIENGMLTTKNQSEGLGVSRI